MREILLWGLMALSLPVVFRRPLIGVIIYLGANVVRPEMLFWGGTGGNFFLKFYFVFTFAACARHGCLKRLSQALQPEYLLMLLLLLAVALSTLTGQYQVEIQNYFLLELCKGFFFVALVYVSVQNFQDLHRVQTVMIGCFAFLSIWGLQQSFLGNERLEGLGGRSWGDSNGVASMFVLFLPMALALYSTSRQRWKSWLFLGAAAMMVVIIVLTKSRAGFIGLTVCIAAFGFYRRKLTKVLAIATVLAMVATPFLADSYIERMKTMNNVSDSEEFEGSARSRLILWKAGLMIFADNPLLGTGFLTYPEAKMKYETNFSYLEEEFRKVVFRTENKKVTHNTYIQLLSDCGLIGALPFFLLVAGGIRKGFTSRRLLNGVGEKPHDELIFLSGLSAGITGFALCIVTLDSVMVLMLYVQIVFAGMLERMVLNEKNLVCRV